MAEVTGALLPSASHRLRVLTPGAKVSSYSSLKIVILASLALIESRECSSCGQEQGSVRFTLATSFFFVFLFFFFSTALAGWTVPPTEGDLPPPEKQGSGTPHRLVCPGAGGQWQSLSRASRRHSLLLRMALKEFTGLSIPVVLQCQPQWAGSIFDITPQLFFNFMYYVCFFL